MNKKIKIALLLLFLNALAFAQKNPSIFKGGVGDGWASQNYLQSSTNIFKGGNGYGWASLNYLQSSVSIFKGGNGDGWDSRNYIQSSADIFKGGIGDGWASGYSPVGPLPKALLNFTAQKQGNNATLVQWKTSLEINSNYFDVERSNDAINFRFIGRVDATGNSPGEISNSFTDNLPLKGLNYYRLKQVGADGQITYTPARLVSFNDATGGSIKYYPNPTNGILNIEIIKEMQQEAMVINIINAAGMVMEQIKQQPGSDALIKIDLKRFARGTYFIQVKTNTTNNTQLVVLQ